MIKVALLSSPSPPPTPSPPPAPSPTHRPFRKIKGHAGVSGGIDRGGQMELKGEAHQVARRRAN